MSRQRSRPVCQAYWLHEYVDYYSSTYRRWSAGFIQGYHSCNSEVILYQVLAGPKLDYRQLITVDILRRPLCVGEPVSYLTEAGWEPCTVTWAAPMTMERRRYSVRLEATGEVIEQASGERLRKRFPPGANAFVYIAPFVGWRKCRVVQELDGPVPSVRPRVRSPQSLPAWSMVIIMVQMDAEDVVQKEVPSYYLSHQDHSLQPPPVGPLINGVVPPIPGVQLHPVETEVLRRLRHRLEQGQRTPSLHPPPEALSGEEVALAI